MREVGDMMGSTRGSSDSRQLEWQSSFGCVMLGEKWTVLEQRLENPGF